MKELNDLSHHFLVAMPTLNDINFSKSVIYIYEHNSEGAMGLIINKPLQITLGNVLQHLDIETSNKKIAATPVLMGGPVGQEHGFVIHDDPDQETGHSVSISASKDILKAIANGAGPNHFLITLGYAGWEPGQLEHEIHRNDWLVAPFDSSILFSTPCNQRWHRAASLLGIDIIHLSSETGHA
jgi:putative transcriptional regulator